MDGAEDAAAAVRPRRAEEGAHLADDVHPAEKDGSRRRGEEENQPGSMFPSPRVHGTGSSVEQTANDGGATSFDASSRPGAIVEEGRAMGSSSSSSSSSSSFVTTADAVLGAIERDGDALASSLVALTTHLKTSLSASGANTSAHLRVHLEASEAMNSCARAAVKEASGLVAEVVRLSEEAARLETLAARARETRRSLEAFEHVANRHLPPGPPGSITSPVAAAYAQLERQLAATFGAKP